MCCEMDLRPLRHIIESFGKNTAPVAESDMEHISGPVESIMLRLAKNRKHQLEMMMDTDNWSRDLSLELDSVNQYIEDHSEKRR